MAMSNTTFRRLNNEWYENITINPVMERYCRKVGIDPYSEHIMPAKMVEVRNFCEKRGVWFKDSDESTIFLNLMPFGGYNDDYSQYKVEIKRFRAWAKDHKRKLFVTTNDLMPLIAADAVSVYDTKYAPYYKNGEIREEV